MAAIRHEAWIDAPIDVVYELLATPEGMSSWWDKQTCVKTSEGEVWEHTPGPEHGTVRMLVLERQHNRLFRWKCISSHQAATPASAWTNTVITFALGDRSSSEAASERWASQYPVQTVLSFTHEGWDASSKYFAFCNSAWGSVLQMLVTKAEQVAKA